MKYEKAQDVLPSEIIELIQNYIDGSYLYIPRKNTLKKSWGEESGIKKTLSLRNIGIYDEYSKGASIKALSRKYYLTEDSIRRIIRVEKKKYS